MITSVNTFSILVLDQDEALEFYTEKLGFEKRTDIQMGPGMRWLTVAPPESPVPFVLQPIDWFEGEEREDRRQRVGRSATTVLTVEDCEKTCAALAARGVKVIDPPAPAGYGIQATIEDLYGNNYVLLQEPSH